MKQDMIVILDLGSTQNTVIARAVRALGVYSEIYPHDITVSELKKLPSVQGLQVPLLRFSFGTNRHFYDVDEVSPPPEPYNPEADPTMKEALDMIRIANEADDEAINRLLNEAAEKVLKED